MKEVVLMQTRLLSTSDIEKVLSMKDIIDILDKTYQGMGNGTVINPTKGTLDLGESNPFPPYSADINSMPAYVGWVDAAGIKWAGGWLKNPEKGLPYVSAMIMMVNPQNGMFTGVLDGTLITNLRTGAQTAVALKYLCSEKKSLSVGLYGAGVQGRTQIRAISELFDIETLKVYDLYPESAAKFAKEMSEVVTGDIIIAKEAEEPANSDVVITVTHAKDKFFKKEWFRPGSILFPMGSYQECDEEALLSADRIVVDHVAQCLHRGALKELGEEGRVTEKDIYATLGELAAGKKTIQLSDQERILCIPIGTGAVDIAVSAVALQKAEEKGLGSSFDFKA